MFGLSTSPASPRSTHVFPKGLSGQAKRFVKSFERFFLFPRANCSRIAVFRSRSKLSYSLACVPCMSTLQGVSVSLGRFALRSSRFRKIALDSKKSVNSSGDIPGFSFHSLFLLLPLLARLDIPSACNSLIICSRTPYRAIKLFAFLYSWPFLLIMLGRARHNK